MLEQITEQWRRFLGGVEPGAPGRRSLVLGQISLSLFSDCGAILTALFFPKAPMFPIIN